MVPAKVLIFYPGVFEKPVVYVYISLFLVDCTIFS